MKNQIDLCPKLQRSQPIYMEEILWLEGLGNYTMVHLEGNRKVLTSKNIGLFGQVLPVDIFWRVNRGLLLRMEAISTWETPAHSPLRLTLINGQTFEVSRRKKTLLKQHLKKTNLNKSLKK